MAWNYECGFTPKGINESILDTYVLDFLDLPSSFDEKSLRKAIIENLGSVIEND